MPFLFSLLFTIACFVLFLLCIHYIYDYIKDEFTQPREISMSTNYKKGIQVSSSDKREKEDDLNKVSNSKQKENKKIENEIVMYRANISDNKHEQEIHVDDELENYFKSLH